MNGFTEDHLIEQPAIQLMEHELGWDSANAFDEWSSGASRLGREAKREVVLTGRLKPALRLSQWLPVLCLVSCRLGSHAEAEQGARRASGASRHPCPFVSRADAWGRFRGGRR